MSTEVVQSKSLDLGLKYFSLSSGHDAESSRSCSELFDSMATRHGGRRGEAALGTSSSFGLVSQNSSTLFQQVRGDDRLFFISWTEGFRTHLLAPAAPRSPSSSSFSSSPGSSCLPPGEEWPSTLETLRVLAVGSLRRSGCFYDYRGHLDQLQGGFTVLQGLAQIQDLRVRGEGKEKELVTWGSYRKSTSFLYCSQELTCPLITATCL